MAQIRSPNSSKAASDTRRQLIRDTTKSLIEQNFASTLGTQDDIVNIFMALMFYESRFNVNAIYPTPLPARSGTISGDYYNSSVIQSMLSNPATTAQQRANEPLGRQAMGLAQVMGMYFVRGASGSGKCFFETARGGKFANQLCVSPGDDIRVKVLGDANVSNAILAGLLVLESKWNSLKLRNGAWEIAGRRFSTRIYGAVGAYLGLGSSGDANGTTFNMYANSIVGGSAYQTANGATAPAVRDSNIQYASVTAAGPTVAVNSSTQGPSGCIAAPA